MKPAGGSKHQIVQDGASTDCRCAIAAPRATHHTCVMAGRSRVRGVVLLTCQAGTLDGRPSFFAGGIREPSSMPACATRFCSSAQARLVGLVAVSLSPHQQGLPRVPPAVVLCCSSTQGWWHLLHQVGKPHQGAHPQHPHAASVLVQ